MLFMRTILHSWYAKSRQEHFNDIIHAIVPRISKLVLRCTFSRDLLMLSELSVFLVFFKLGTKTDSLNMSFAYPGEPLKILDFGAGSVDCRDNFGKFYSILTSQPVIDRKFAVVSIVGAGNGKSFLLNYCLRYLYATVSRILN